MIPPICQDYGIAYTQPQLVGQLFRFIHLKYKYLLQHGEFYI